MRGDSNSNYGKLVPLINLGAREGGPDIARGRLVPTRVAAATVMAFTPIRWNRERSGHRKGRLSPRRG